MVDVRLLSDCGYCLPGCGRPSLMPHSIQMQKLACLLAVLLMPLAAQPPANGTWKFAVSGDSRNCGDIVMPAIASGVLASRSEFYWHLGDFRAIYTFDEDMVPPAKLALPTKPLSIIDYENGAWPDFIDRSEEHTSE